MLPLRHKGGALYQQALELAKEVYQLTDTFSQTERALLVYTMRRATVLLCQDVATGFAKRGKKRRKIFQAVVDNCIALDAQLELALAINLATAEAAATTAHLLHSVYQEAIKQMRSSNLAANAT